MTQAKVTFTERAPASVIGGPEILLGRERRQERWAGLPAMLEEFRGGMAPEARILFHHFSHEPIVLDRLYRLGVESVDTEFKSGFMRVTGLFRWCLYRDHFVPLHWRRFGVERAIALYRIFGPDETKWPSVEGAA